MQTVGPFWSRLRKWTYPHAYGLITMTRGAMNYFPPQMRKRQWVIPNPAHLPDEAKPYRADGRTMAAVGRMVPQKGFDRLLDAFSRIATARSEERRVGKECVSKCRFRWCPY